MGKSLYGRIIDEIGHDYHKNYVWLKKVAENYDVKSLPEEEYKKLDSIFSACLQLHFFEEELSLDISEVDIKKYMLDSEYRGKFFELEALKDMFEDAQEGNVDAMMFLTSAFCKNYFSPGLSKYASYWCEKAAEAGDVKAMCAIASIYRWGEYGVFVDIPKAIGWYKKAAELGDKDAISFMEHFGDGQSNNMLELSALHGIQGEYSKWYRSRWMVSAWYKEADEGNAEAQYELGRQLTPGIECGALKRNTKESIKYYEMAAEQGVVDAMFNLANLYLYGWSDLEPDPEKEFYWRKRAADVHDMEAAYMTGKMYIEGKGTYENFEVGLHYLKIAAESSEAKNEIREYYQSVCKVEKIYQEKKDQIVPINSDFYLYMEEDDRKYLQEYLNHLMYDQICGMKNKDGDYVLGTYNHIVTLIEFAVRQSKPVVELASGEHSEDELDYLVKRFLYYYLDSIQGEEDFYNQMGNCTRLDEKKHRQQLHKVFWGNLDNSIRSVQKDFPDFMKDWIFGCMG